MTHDAEQQPPRAADVPEAVLAAIHRYQAAVIDAVIRFGKQSAMREFVAAESALEAAIATALREAKEQGAADTARLDWLTESSGGWTEVGKRFHRACYLYVSRGMGHFRAALDAARAAEPEDGR